MLLRIRSLYGPPPSGEQRPQSDHPTLLWSWFCTIASFVVIMFRIFGRLTRTNYLFREDWVMLIAIIPLFIRMGFIHVVLNWGTNNVDTNRQMSDLELHHRVVGSKLVLGARVFYALFVWTAKLAVSEFLKRLTHQFWKSSYQLSLHIIRLFLLVSFIAVLIATLSECQPITHYWQVIPDPGPQCRQSYAQLITMATADILTDILLIVFPLTIIIPAAMPVFQKARLVFLFSLSAILIAITIIRVISVINEHGRQQRRTVYASGEILAAAAVANTVVLGSFLRDRGVKRNKWRSSTHSDGSGVASVDPEAVQAMQSRRPTVRKIYGELDEDEEDARLFADMCYVSRVSTEAQRSDSFVRPAMAVSQAELERHDSAAIASHALLQNVKEQSGKGGSGSGSPRGGSRASSVVRGRSRLGSRKPGASKDRNGSKATRDRSEPKLAKTVTFSDIGGLLDSASSDASTAVAGMPRRERRSDERTRAGSLGDLQDVGGLLGGGNKSGREGSQDSLVIKEIRSREV